MKTCGVDGHARQESSQEMVDSWYLSPQRSCRCLRAFAFLTLQHTVDVDSFIAHAQIQSVVEYSTSSKLRFLLREGMGSKVEEAGDSTFWAKLDEALL